MLKNIVKNPKYVRMFLKALPLIAWIVFVSIGLIVGVADPTFPPPPPGGSGGSGT
ncbi:MAG: hypothetical protein ACTSPG_08765 [Candidatus Hodarchaeales archaeon]